jgi:hypothetical protein
VWLVQTISPTSVEVADSSLAVLIGTFAPTAKSGDVLYNNVREVWVDPVTGSFIKVREQPHQTFKPDVGSPVDLLDADFTYTPDTIKNSAQSAKDNGFQLGLIKLYLPIAAALVGLILLVVGVLMLRKRTTKATADDGADGTVDAELPAARHSLRDESDENRVWTG